MISMVEKIHRLELKDCEAQLERMVQELKEHRKEFLRAPELLDFERKWIDAFL